jgi:hypothetical protein
MGYTHFDIVCSKSGYYYGDPGSETLFLNSSGMLNPRYEDLFVPLTQTRQGATAKPVFDTTEVGFLFPQNDATEILYFIIQFPHGRQLGSSIYPHVHWKQGSSNVATFKLGYKWFNIASTTTGAFSTYVMDTVENTYTTGTTIHQINVGTSPISPTTMGISSIMLCKLYRDDNVYVGNAVAYQFDVHILKDSWGSREEYQK